MQIPSLLRAAVFTALASLPLDAAVSLPAQTIASNPTAADGPAKLAMDAFAAGHHAKAIELAKPLADDGVADAIYLMGFAYESGKGVVGDRAKAVAYYRKGAEKKHKDSIYRLSFILLASEKPEERDQARLALETAAKDDPTVAARILGEAYLRSLFTATPDSEKALFWWQQAAAAGDVPSILLIARFYEGQFGFPELKNQEKAIAAYAKAAGLGNPGAMAALGSRYLSGDAKIRDEKKGREWLKKAIAAKEYSAYLALGDFEENVKKNLKAALAEYERGKDAGQIDCMVRAADFYIEGKGIEKDPGRGHALLKSAAEAGNATANFRLAVQALSGTKPDLFVGYGFLLAAANGNLAEAQNELALLYLSGKFAGTDTIAGIAWLTRAANAGSPQAQNNLATLYERGVGTEQNLETAGQLYTLAANQGHGPATLALARLIFNGVGTPADPVKAWALASMASERGDKNATKLIETISNNLTAKQKPEAQKQLAAMKSGKSQTPQPKTVPAPKRPK